MFGLWVGVAWFLFLSIYTIIRKTSIYLIWMWMVEFGGTFSFSVSTMDMVCWYSYIYTTKLPIGKNIYHAIISCIVYNATRTI